MKNVSNLLSLLMYLLMYGVSGETDGVSVMKGDSITLTYLTEISQQEDMMWYFNNISIVEITGDPTKICTDVRCDDRNERFRGRLKLDRQTGTLTILNTRTTDAGLYDVWVSSKNPRGEGSYSVVVQDSTGVGTDEVSAYAMEEDSVTLQTNVNANQQEKIKWYFNDIRIAQINGDLSKTCTDVQCNGGAERFYDRLKLDDQSGSLTITNINTTDAGLYQLEIISDRINIMKRFSVFVQGFPSAERDDMRRKSVREGESVTLDPGEIKNLNDFLTWYFKDTLIAKITGNQNKICAADQCDERFRDRLKVNHTARTSLIITDMRTSDSGLYKLTITNIRFSIIKRFEVTVIAAVKVINAVAVAVVAAVVVLLLVASAVAVIYYQWRQYSAAQSSHQNHADSSANGWDV